MASDVELIARHRRSRMSLTLNAAIANTNDVCPATCDRERPPMVLRGEFMRALSWRKGAGRGYFSFDFVR